MSQNKNQNKNENSGAGPAIGLMLFTAVLVGTGPKWTNRVQITSEMPANRIEHIAKSRPTVQSALCVEEQLNKILKTRGTNYAGALEMMRGLGIEASPYFETTNFARFYVTPDNISPTFQSYGKNRVQICLGYDTANNVFIRNDTNDVWP